MIAVVHLVWGPLRAPALRDFLDSYRHRPAGAEHELVVLFNGVSDEQRPELEAVLENVEHRLLVTPEAMQDLAAYAYAAEQLKHERICFLNSYSAILAEDWLAKLAGGLDEPHVGLVGATGSWASLHSAVLNSFMFPNPYKGVVPKRRVAREEMRGIEMELEAGRQGDTSAKLEPLPARTLGRSILSTLQAFRVMPGQFVRFPAFPAYHVRTNAFMFDRRVFGSLRVGRVASKADAYLLESGRDSFTRQVQRMGLRTLVVARDGRSYDHEQWHSSCTFWQHDQQQLMVADNQTRSYINGSFDRRRLLSAFAWGPLAEPGLPARVTESNG